MSSNVTKRALSAGLGVGALALLAPRASADTPFSSFAFPATGAPTARTLPDRLGELKNVKDFGAMGDGVHDDTAAFTAAVERAGSVWVPPGDFFVSGPIPIGGGQQVEIVGVRGAQVRGNFRGYLFDCPVWNGDIPLHAAFRNIDMRNDMMAADSGCIRITGGMVVAINYCQFRAWRPVTMVDVIDFAIRDCFFGSLGNGSSDSQSGIFQQASVGVDARTNNGLIENCDFSSFYKGINIQQYISVRDCRLEMCDRGIVLGENAQGQIATLGGAIIEGCEMEANNIHIHLAFSGGVNIRACGLLGDPFCGIVDQNPRLPGRNGLLVQRAEQLVVQSLNVSGMWTDAGIKFEHPSPWPDVATTVFMATTSMLQAGSPAGSAAWKGLETLAPGAVTFMQCNQPTS
jgi:Pectate lyase superfamily protein